MSLNKCTVINDILHLHRDTRPEAVAAVDGDTRLDYRALAEAVEARARALLAAGVNPGDRVATLAPPGLEFWIDFLATTSIGAIWQGLNPRYRGPEYAYLLNDARPAVVFVHSPYDGRDYARELVALAPDGPRFVVHGDAVEGAVSIAEFLGGGRTITTTQLRAAHAAVQPEDVAVIVYTSGTTGRPKGAMLSHRAIVANARANAEWMGDGLESTLCAAPINHVGALNNVCMSVFAQGGRIVFFNRVDLVALSELTLRERPTYLVASPTSFVMMRQSPDLGIGLLGSVKLLVVGGAKTPQALLAPYVDTIPRIHCVYGQTECCGIATRTDPGSPLEIVCETFGKPFGGMELRIVDASGAPCRTGETGEIQLRGPFVLSGYFGNPAATAEVFTSDGFMRTGDLGYLREDGNAVYVGRLKEMYKSGGYNIYPVELEQAICSHEKVAEAVVVPVASALYQEVGYAFVAARPGVTLEPAELERHLRDRLANYKIPKYWSIESELPHLPNSKIDRMELKRRVEGFEADR
jgi:acyl-CoA synthetase (AMP-forming)/AMP-acid ligase II